MGGIEYTFLAFAALVFIGGVVAAIRNRRSLDTHGGRAVIPNLAPDESTAYYEPWFKPNELVEYTERGCSEPRVGVVELEQWGCVLIRTIDFLPGGGFLTSQRRVYGDRRFVRRIDRSRFDPRDYPTTEIAGWGK